VLISSIPIAVPEISSAAATLVSVAPLDAGWSGVTVLFIAALAFIAGAAAIFVFLRQNDKSAADTSELQKKILKSDQQLKRYQQEVSEHFITVSHLTTNIAQSYRQIHEHLASSAIRLASPEIGRQLLKSGGISLLDAEGNPLISMDDVEVPRDYAPKVPGGVLSEGYGLTDADAEIDSDSDLLIPNTAHTPDTESDPTENVS